MARSNPTRPGSDEGRRRILTAARKAFATHGFEGARLRAISTEARVLHTALLYHFPSKDALWRAVMADLFDEVTTRFNLETARLKGTSPDQLARSLVRDFVAFCAACPELHRIMTMEGRSDTDRLSWLVDTYSRRLFENVVTMAPVAMPALRDPIQLYYAIIGLSASVFTLAPEYKRLSGRDPFSSEEVTRTADLVERLVFGSNT